MLENTGPMWSIILIHQCTYYAIQIGFNFLTYYVSINKKLVDVLKRKSYIVDFNIRL